MYSQKIIQNLKPDWYMQLSKSDKLKEQERLKKEHNEAWQNKPKPLFSGEFLTAKETRKSITKNRGYKVIGYFATLVTTIYDSQWNEFVTLKNDYGWTVKMNLRNFNKGYESPIHKMQKRITELENQILKSKQQ